MNSNIRPIILFNIYGHDGGSFDGCCYDQFKGIGPCIKIGGGPPRIFLEDKRKIL